MKAPDHQVPIARRRTSESRRRAAAAHLATVRAALDRSQPVQLPSVPATCWLAEFRRSGPRVVSFSFHAGATEAGVTKGTPCLYFESKALFQQLYNSWD